MKQLLLIFTLFCASYMTVNAQTTTWTGNVDNNWSNVGNWSLNAMPIAANDVVIPTGKTVILNVAATIKSIAVQGNSTFTIPNSLSFTNASSFAANTTIIFSDGNIRGGGTLTNNGTINFTTTGNKYFYDNTVLNNLGTINFTGAGILYINDGTLNNQASGTIDFQVANSNISYTAGGTHKINNYGLIKRTSTGTVSIVAELHNDGGTIAVQTGELTLNFGSVKLTGGVYNVSANASLNWLSTVTCAGTLTGSLNGQINWSGIVSVPVAATFNFTGSTGVNWNDGSLRGGGTLINQSEITLASGANKYVYDNSTLTNNGDINLESIGVWYINDGTINNSTTGTIDLKFAGNNIYYTAGGLHVLNNSGLIKSTIPSGACSIGVVLNNNDGTISVESGILNFDNLSKNLNDGVYNVTTGTSLNWNSQIVLSGTLTGALDGELAWNGEVNVPISTSANFNFTGSTGVNWNDGSLRGGGTLINQSEITLASGANKYLYDNSILTNNGDMNLESIGVLYINDGTINNSTTGTIDLKATGNYIYYTAGGLHVLNNSGLIKSTIPSGACSIGIVLNNNDGTISVESGILNFDTLSKNLNDGVYNVATGTSLNWNSQIVLSGTLTGALDGELAWNGEVNVPSNTTANFDFTGTTGVNWSNGSLRGAGTLVNDSEITLNSTNNKYIYDNSVMTNNGTINIESVSLWYVNDGTINNSASGIIDLKANGSYIYYTAGALHQLNNSGLIKCTVDPTNQATIGIVLNNNGGTISVESGVLNFASLPKYLNGGIYNVDAGTALVWNSQTILSGNLTGLLDGEVRWINEVNIPTGTTANFDFTGTTGVNWSNGYLNGGGSLVNKSEITLNGDNKYIYSNSILNNEGIINHESTGIFYINDGTLNNQDSGIIDVKIDGTFMSFTAGSTHVLNNFGLLKKSAGTDLTSLNMLTTNSGTIDAQTGTLNFVDGYVFNNTVDGIIKGNATIDIPGTATYTNDGTFAPGGSPGVLTVLGTYKSSTTSVLDVELNGLTSGTQYDVLAINGTNAIFDGTVNVTMGFEANLNDEFIVATTTGTISQCNLATTTSADFNGMIYTFDVFCRNDNQVVLGVTNIALGVDDFELTESSIQLYPNPVRNILTIKNVKNLELENGSIMDITGKIITTFNLKNMGLTNEISLENLSSGLYFVKITGLNSSITKRVIKQ